MSFKWIYQNRQINKRFLKISKTILFTKKHIIINYLVFQYILFQDLGFCL